MKSFEGICRICLKPGRLTFEHTPPRKAVQIFSPLNVNDAGCGGYTLCSRCNFLTGVNYAPAFIDFCRQFQKNISGKNNLHGASKHAYHLQPLNLLKQIMTIFLVLDNENHLNQDKQLREFILNTQSRKLSREYRIFISSVNLPEPNIPSHIISEGEYEFILGPLLFKMTTKEKSYELIKVMEEISFMKNYQINEHVRFNGVRSFSTQTRKEFAEKRESFPFT